MIRLAALILAVFPVAAKAQIEIQEVTSPGGLTAWLVEDHSIPFVALDIRFAGGASLDPPEDHGATYLMMGLLEEGAGDMDARAFAEAVEGLAAQFSFDARTDTVSIEASILTQNRDAAVALLREALVDPAFAEPDIERVRGQVLSIIERNATDPAEIAAAALDRMVYGDHPYARTLEGTVESVAALTREDLVEAHRAALALDRVHIGVAGDITPEELGPLLDTLLGDLPVESTRDLPGEAPITLSGDVTVIDFPTPQSTVGFVHPGVGLQDEDFFPAFVLAQILGGAGFDSRLMTEVRVNRGLTYGIYAYLANFQYANVLVGSFSSSNDLVAGAIDVIEAEWQALDDGDLTEEELEAAQLYMTGSYPLRFAGNANIAGILAGMQFQGMPIDYVNDRNSYVEAVTLEDLRRVAAELLDPERLTFAVVGEPEGLAAD